MTQTADIMDRTMDNVEQNAAGLAELVSPTTLIRAHEPLAKRTTLRVGGPADIYVEPATEEDLAAVLNFCGGRGLPFFVLGRGSNLLVRDGGFRGVVICLAQPFFSRIEISGTGVPLMSSDSVEKQNIAETHGRDARATTLVCGAGAKLKNVAVEAKRNGLSGLEFLEGIPGSVGGALRMNAGAMGSETFDVVESVRFIDRAGEIHVQSANGMTATYRSCALLKTHIALSATFHAKPASRAEVEERMRLFSGKRWASQPAAPSAGCMFKNPPTIPAGRLIDELGLKGLRIGGAVVSGEHGNFLVNDGNATASDVLKLIETVKQRVKAERGIELQTEVEVIGE